MIRRAAIVGAVILSGCGRPALTSVTPTDIQESYLLEQIHREWAGTINKVVDQWWGWCGGGQRIDSHTWPTDRVVTVYQNNHPTVYKFSQLGYDPALSSLSYGNPSVTTSLGTKPDYNYIYDLSAETADGKFEQSESVTLSQSRSVTVTRGVEFDASVSSETKVSGTFAGIGLEEALTATVGYTNTSEKEQAAAESADTTTTHTFDVSLPAGQVTQITLGVANATAAANMAMDAVAAWQVDITLGVPCTVKFEDPDWWDRAGSWVINEYNTPVWDQCGWSAIGAGPRGHTSADYAGYIQNHPCTFRVGVDVVTAMFSGEVAEWQGMAGEPKGRGRWIEKQPAFVPATLAKAQDPGNRAVRIHGVQTLHYQSSLLTRTRAVDPGDVDDLVAAGARRCDPSSATC